MRIGNLEITNWYGILACILLLWTFVQIVTVSVIAEIKEKAHTKAWQQKV